MNFIWNATSEMSENYCGASRDDVLPACGGIVEWKLGLFSERLIWNPVQYNKIAIFGWSLFWNATSEFYENYCGASWDDVLAACSGETRLSLFLCHCAKCVAVAVVPGVRGAGNGRVSAGSGAFAELLAGLTAVCWIWIMGRQHPLSHFKINQKHYCELSWIYQVPL